MPRRGSREVRNADFKTRRAAQLAAADSGEELLTAAYDWLRASLALLEKRRPPRGVPQDVHREQADQLRRNAAEYLTRVAQQIDQGTYDARGVA